MNTPSSRSRFDPVRAWHALGIPVFGTVLVAALWVAVWQQLSGERRNVVEAELRQTEAYVAAFEQHARRVLGEADRTLLQLKSEIERTGRSDMARMRSLGIIHENDVTVIGMVDRDGDIVATSRPVDRSFNASSRPFFRELAASDTGTMKIGKPFVAPGSGRTVLAFARRINGLDGAFAGAVAIIVRPDVITDFYLESELGKRGVLGMFGMDGAYRARRSGTGAGGGNVASNSGVLARAQSTPAGAYEGPNPVDGQMRLVAYRRLADYPMVVMAAQSTEEALAGYRAHRDSTVLLATLATLALTAFFVALTWSQARLRREGAKMRQHKEFYERLLDHVPIGISVRRMQADGQGTYIAWNETNAAMFEIPKPRAIGNALHQVVPTGLAGEFERRDRELVENPGVQDFVQRVARHDAPEVFVRRVRAPIFNAADNVEYVVTVSMDVTREHRAAQEQRLASQVFETTADGIVVTDADDRVLMVNQAFTRLTGFAAGDVAGRDLGGSAFRPLDTEGRPANVDLLRRDGILTAEMRCLHRDGHELALWVTASIVRDEAGGITHHVRVFTDISELKLAQRQLELLANHDQLTGLPNRRLFADRLETALERARRSGQSVGLLYVDLDGFKAVNDALGHGAGDRFLKSVAARLKSSLRASDSLCRLGGDEFTVIVEGASAPEQAVTVAQRVQAALESPIVVDGRPMRVTASIGIAVLPPGTAAGDALVAQADGAMYRAKTAGGNQYVMHAQQPTLVAAIR